MPKQQLMSIDPHRCLAAKHCRAVTIEDGRRIPAHTDKPDSLCEECTRGVSWVIDDMAGIWLALHAAIGEQTRKQGQKVGGSRSAPINLNTDADALKMAIVEWLVGATAGVAAQLNIDDPRPRNHSDTEHARIVIACTRILSAHVDDLLALPPDDVMVWASGGETEYPGERHVDENGIPHNGVRIDRLSGVQLALRLTDLRHKARKLLNLTNPLDKLSLPCPHCNEYELVRTHRLQYSSGGKKPSDEETDRIDCGSCGIDWPYSRYQHLCEIWVKDDEMEREKLQKQLDQTANELALTKWLLAKREWQFTLALQCTDVPASVFAETVLAPVEPDNLDDYMSDKDIAAIVGVADSTIRSWAHRGAIKRHTADDGSTVYLAREVWTYATTNTSGRTTTERQLDNRRKVSA
jgi:hypothetical protein